MREHALRTNTLPIYSLGVEAIAGINFTVLLLHPNCKENTTTHQSGLENRNTNTMRQGGQKRGIAIYTKIQDCLV